jgi:hypothetical protein
MPSPGLFGAICKKVSCRDIIKETSDFTIITGLLPYLLISDRTKFKTKTCALLKPIIG